MEHAFRKFLVGSFVAVAGTTSAYGQFSTAQGIALGIGMNSSSSTPQRAITPIEQLQNRLSYSQNGFFSICEKELGLPANSWQQVLSSHLKIQNLVSCFDQKTVNAFKKDPEKNYITAGNFVYQSGYKKAGSYLSYHKEFGNVVHGFCKAEPITTFPECVNNVYDRDNSKRAMVLTGLVSLVAAASVSSLLYLTRPRKNFVGPPPPYNDMV